MPAPRAIRLGIVSTAPPSSGSIAATVLLVDDNPVLLRQTEEYLKERRFAVFCTSSPFSVITMVRDHNPQVVVLDVMMPGLDGERVYEFLEKTGTLTRAPLVIFYSAIAEEQLYKMCKGRPRASYVLKSDGPRALREAILKRLSAA